LLLYSVYFFISKKSKSYYLQFYIIRWYKSFKYQRRGTIAVKETVAAIIEFQFIESKKNQTLFNHDSINHILILRFFVFLIFETF